MSKINSSELRYSLIALVEDFVTPVFIELKFFEISLYKRKKILLILKVNTIWTWHNPALP